MLLFWIGAFSSILSIFLWLRDVIANSGRNWVKLLYPLVFVAFSTITIYQSYQLGELNRIETEADRISRNWPEPSGVEFISKGERLGIILAGQTFLEKHKDIFPDTYKDYQSLKKGRLGNYEFKSDFKAQMDEYDALEDVCSATITIVKNLRDNSASAQTTH